MATTNPFDLLGDDDAEDPSQLIAAKQQKIESKKTQAPSVKPAAGKLPSKPLPPAQAVREAKAEPARGGRDGGRGYSRGGRGAGGGSYRDSNNNENSYNNRDISGGPRTSDGADTGKPFERHGGYGEPRGPYYHGGRRGGSNKGDVREGDGDHQRRPFERHSGTGLGNDMKREGAGPGNSETQTDELAQVTEEAVNKDEEIVNLNAEKPSGEEEVAAAGGKEAATKVVEKNPEDKEMTLEEYEKVLEEKRKALLALKTEGTRKVDVKEFESMQQLSNKKANDNVFVKLGSEKDKKKDLAEKEERAKKSVSINEFLKPAEGEKLYGGGRGRGRGRGARGGYVGGGEMNNVRVPAIEDPAQFPTLGSK